MKSRQVRRGRMYYNYIYKLQATKHTTVVLLNTNHIRTSTCNPNGIM